jgi:hypothetical protein
LLPAARAIRRLKDPIPEFDQVKVLGGEHPAGEAAHPVHVVGARTPGAECGQLWLDAQPRSMISSGLVSPTISAASGPVRVGRLSKERPLTAMPPDQALGRERLQDPTHSPPADAELRGKVALRWKPAVRSVGAAVYQAEQASSDGVQVFVGMRLAVAHVNQCPLWFLYDEQPPTAVNPECGHVRGDDAQTSTDADHARLEGSLGCEQIHLKYRLPDARPHCGQDAGSRSTSDPRVERGRNWTVAWPHGQAARSTAYRLPHPRRH